MALFGFGKKKEVAKDGCDCGGACEQKTDENKEKGCCCGGDCNQESEKTAEASDLKENKKEEAAVKILGSGCAKCNQLEAVTKEALAKLGMDTTIEHVTDYAQIASYGVMTTPALVIDGKVVSYGKVLKTEEIFKILQQLKG